MKSIHHIHKEAHIPIQKGIVKTILGWSFNF